MGATWNSTVSCAAPCRWLWHVHTCNIALLPWQRWFVSQAFLGTWFLYPRAGSCVKCCLTRCDNSVFYSVKEQDFQLAFINLYAAFEGLKSQVIILISSHKVRLSVQVSHFPVNIWHFTRHYLCGNVQKFAYQYQYILESFSLFLRLSDFILFAALLCCIAPWDLRGGNHLWLVRGLWESLNDLLTRLVHTLGAVWWAYHRNSAPHHGCQNISPFSIWLSYEYRNSLLWTGWGYAWQLDLSR